MKIDTSKPHIGRIYDFILGGHHNYEVDRQFAVQMLASFPPYPKIARLNRWYLQLIGSRWAEQGVKRVLDLGSGLPTQGHLNDYLSDARILFSDNDPLSVTYGGEILKDNANMKYILADVREPGPLLEEATRFFGDERRIAIGFFGLSYFLSDDLLASLAQRLHAWCAPGSVMAISFGMPNADAKEGETPAIVHTIKKLGLELHFRTVEELGKVIAPWTVVEAQPLDKTLEMEGMLTKDDASTGIDLLGATAVY